MNVPAKLGPSTRSVGAQVLLWVNGAWVLLAAGFLVYDYHRDLHERLEEKRIALHEEAKTLMPAVLQIRRYGRDEIQQYIDAVCSQMRDVQSPGHHIIVETESDVIQARAHHRASPEILRAVRRASLNPNHKSAFGADELVVGSYTVAGTTIYVSETLENLRRAVIGDAAMRSTAIFVSPADMLAYINRALMNASLETGFVSMALARVAGGIPCVEYASAGHEPSWILSPDGVIHELSSTGMLLGIEEESRWDDVTIEVGIGHRLLMVTDGVSETLSSQGDLYGRTRIRGLLEACRHDPVKETLLQSGKSLESHRMGAPQHDDVTMLLIELAESYVWKVERPTPPVKRHRTSARA